MNNAQVVDHLQRALYLIMALSMPSIVVAAIVGFLFAVIQALTQIQEQTLSYAVKLVALAAVLGFSAHWIGSELYVYTVALFDEIAHM